ncbi:TPA: hypothetical protein ACGQDE_004259, partial [Escherichia coli]
AQTPAAIIPHSLLLTITPICLFLLQKRRERGKTYFFPFPGGTTEHCERVSYDVPVIADQPLLYS